MTQALSEAHEVNRLLTTPEGQKELLEKAPVGTENLRDAVKNLVKSERATDVATKNGATSGNAAEEAEAPEPQELQIPDQVKIVLNQIQKSGNAPAGYVGGKVFKNDGRGGGEILPQTDASGNYINYNEYDVKPFQKGVNRGPERIVIGSDGSAYYTSDHYDTFIRVIGK